MGCPRLGADLWDSTIATLVCPTCSKHLILVVRRGGGGTGAEAFQSNAGWNVSMKTEDYKIVIFLATLNGAKFLKDQLKSYRAQTHSNWELLASDDGSVDQTVDLVGNFANS